jgi:hypothetical protein
MKRFLVLAACGLGLSGCASLSLPSWMSLDSPAPTPTATTMQFESEPAGAEAKTSDGQSCRTPCSLAVTSSEFTVTFSMTGHQPQTVPVRVVGDADPNEAPRLVPNPVFVELRPTAPPPKARKPAPRKPKPAAAPRPAPTAMAPAQPAPAPAPASPWPPPPSTTR